NPLAWQKAKLSPALFKPNEVGVFDWVAQHVIKHHALPQIQTLTSQFPSEFSGLDTPEPSSYYTDLLEKSYFYSQINNANIQSQEILKNDQQDYEKASLVLQSALNAITLQKYRLRMVDVAAEAPKMLVSAYHSVGLAENTSILGWDYMDSQA